MICIKADIPEELNEIDDELKAVYHSKDSVCFFLLNACSDQYLLRYNRLQGKENQRLLYVDNKGLLVSCSCFVLLYRPFIQYTQEVVF